MTASELGELIDRLAGPLTLYARQWVDWPEDIVQEAFMRFVRHPQPTAKAIPWLYRVVRNAAIDSLKSTRRREVREQHHAQSRDWFVEPAIDGLDAVKAVESLKSLPLEQREVIAAHFWGGLTFEQIAILTNSSATTAFRRYQTGIAQLRLQLEGPCETKPKTI
jgi:RNA polymerase sigma-70 factor (ECF subfamily)